MVLAATPNQHSSLHYESFAALFSVKFFYVGHIAFRTICTDINGPLLLSKRYIAAATHG